MKKIAVLLFVVCAAVSVFAEVDNRVLNAINASGLKYEINPETDDFGITFDNGVMVWVNSNTETFAGREIREVYGWVLHYDGPIDAGVKHNMLRINNTYKIGSWALDSDGDAIFCVKIAPNVNGEELRQYIMLVAEVISDFETDVVKMNN